MDAFFTFDNFCLLCLKYAIRNLDENSSVCICEKKKKKATCENQGEVVFKYAVLHTLC